MKRMLGLCALFSVLVLGSVLAPAALADDETEREIKAIQKNVREMLEKAEELEAQGKDAAQLRMRAKAIRDRLNVFLERREKERAHADRERDGEHRDKRAKRRKDLARMKAIMRGLGQGIEALQALGDKEAAAHLTELRQRVRHRLEDESKAAGEGREREQKSERQVAREWLELMHMAHKVLNEAKRGDCAEVMEHGMLALELALKGRRDEEAMKVRESSPKRAQLAQCLAIAAEILQDQGQADRAKMLARLARRWRGGDRDPRHREREHERERAERRRGPMAEHLEIMGLAKKALMEADNERLAHQLELAMHWRELQLEGQGGGERARDIRRRAPTPVNLGEILIHAAGLWREFGHEEKAAHVHELGEHFLGGHGDRAREGRAHVESLEHLHGRLEELRRRLQELKEQLGEINRSR